MYMYEWPRPSVTVDVVLFSPDKSHILCVRRSKEPFKDYLALPGGYLEIDERCREGAVRELREETNINVRPEELMLVNVFDEVERDTRGRVISVCYTARLKDYRMPKAGDDAAGAEWIMIGRLQGELKLAFDHQKMIEQVLNDNKCK